MVKVVEKVGMEDREGEKAVAPKGVATAEARGSNLSGRKACLG